MRPPRLPIAVLLATLLLAGLTGAGAPPPERVSDRQHHYVFVHLVLPRLFYRDGERLAAGLAERRTELLRAMWVDLGERSFTRAQIPPDGLEVVVPAAEGGARIILLVFPRPGAAAEGYFAALVTLPDGTRRYVTLERPVNPANAGRDSTRLGGWDEEGGHLDFGAGPPPVLAEFERAVRRLVREGLAGSAPGNRGTDG